MRHHKKKHNKTRRLGKKFKSPNSQKGGRHEFNLAQLKRNMKDGHHLFAVHSSDACGHCRQFKQEWEKIMERLPYNPKLTVARLGPDATDYMNNQHYRKHNYSVDAVPTIVYYIVNKEAPREYEGERDADKILEWFERLTTTMKDNDLELTIKPKSEVMTQQPVSFEDDEPVSQDFKQPQGLEPHESLDEEQLNEEPQELKQQESLDEESLEQDLQQPEPLTQPVDTAANAFPSSPLSPASITETVSTKANELNEQLKSATESATNAVSDVGTKIANMFSSSDTKETPKPEQTPTTKPNVPQVPSLVGGIRRRKMTQRKHRKSKSTKKSKRSKK